MYYHELGAVETEADFWKKVRNFGYRALDEIEDAADGVFGKNVNEKWLAWSKEAKNKLETAIKQKDPAVVTRLQKEAEAARAELPTAFSYNIYPFLSITIPKTVKDAARSREQAAVVSRAAADAAAGAGAGGYGGGGMGGNVLGLALIGIAAAILLATRK